MVLDHLGPDPQPDSDSSFRLENESQRRDVLITQDQANLSTFITFENIRMHALPLARDDIPEVDNGVFAICVPISLAVNLIADWKHRGGCL